MGMDVYGLNPKMNKKMSEFPTMEKMNKLEEEGKWKDKWEILDNDRELTEKYWKEKDEYERINKGAYFRNNCWYWRPLWDFCYNVAKNSPFPSLISQELWESGHSNSGAGLNDEDAKLLGAFLLQAIEDGNAEDYKVYHESQEKDEKYKYPFDIENVKEFAHFCIESGGFEIC